MDAIDALHAPDTPEPPSVFADRHPSHASDFDQSVSVPRKAFDTFLDARDAWRDASTNIRAARATPDPARSAIHPLSLHLADTTLHAIR